MQLKSFRVQKFRNIEDSGEVELLDPLTCVVGKNQAGKSALLRGLHKFNPHSLSPYDMRHEWPRGQRTKRNENQTVCEVRFTLSAEELKQLSEIAGQELSGEEVVVTRNYGGDFQVQFPEDSTLFPVALEPNLIDAICQNFPPPTEPVSEKFRAAATKCILEAKRYTKDVRFEELKQLRTRHGATLRRKLTQEDTEFQRTNETQFILEYKEKLTEVNAKLASECTKNQKATDYIVSVLPTFIYMDDYKAFRGRANLEGLKERQDNKKLDLSEEDETFLMILKLGGLDLDKLIEQGKSEDADVIHDRQIDLQDSAMTLTNGVAERWGQNEYHVQFRADSQVFFTEIEETGKNIGMIPLEEQSKGFQWFFSFDLHFMHDSDGTFEGCVLLLDEPGLHLHPGSVVAWIGTEMEFARSQAVASGDAFEHRPPECGHCVQNFLADLDLRDLPGEAAGFELGADHALPTTDLRFYPAALVVPCGHLPGHAAVAADLGNMAIPNGWIPRRLRSDHCVLRRRYNHIQGLPIPPPQHIPYRRSIIGAVSQKARDRSIELIQEPG